MTHCSRPMDLLVPKYRWSRIILVTVVLYTLFWNDELGSRNNVCLPATFGAAAFATSPPTSFSHRSSPLVQRERLGQRKQQRSVNAQDGRRTVLQSSSSSDKTSDSYLEINGGAKSPPTQPTLAAIAKFAVPCLALWISGPLLSLVDTASVGLSAAPGTGALQLGALGPSTTFIDGSTYLFAFLNVATTNLYAGALAQYLQSNRRGAASLTKEEQRIAGDGVARTSVKSALIAGFLLLGLLLSPVGRFLLRIYIGVPSNDEKFLPQASDYVRIRAFSMPTSLLGGVLQASLLGAKDSVTPLIAIAYSTVVNVFGDILCVAKLGMGIRGAALATTLAQWAGTAAMIKPARDKLFAPRSDDGSRAVGTTKVTSGSFLSFAAPVLTLILGKIAAFGFMTHVAAALPGEASLAAHQIVLSLFFFVSPFLEVISQTAQAFLPQYLTEDSEDWLKEAEKLSGRLLRIGIVVAATVGCLAGAVTRSFPNLLTNDATVQAAVRPLSGPLALGAVLTAPVAVSEGILLARRELKFLAGVYLISTALLPYILLRIKTFGGPVVDIWRCFAVFQLFRATCFTGRIWGPRFVGWLMRGLGVGSIPSSTAGTASAKPAVE